MERLRAIMRMTAVRLSAIYFLTFSVVAVALVFYVTGSATNILLAQSRSAIAEEIEGLGRIYERAGIIGLVRSIDRRSRQPGASLYLLADPAGRILAGNVQSLQAGVLDDAGFIDDAFAYERYSTGSESQFHVAIAQVEQLPNGLHVLVGRDQTDQVRFRSVVRNALIVALAIMGAAALLTWFLVGRRALQRLDRMSASSARILAGDLEERLPVTGANDEFDRLSENLNTLLARIARLQEGLRQVSDNIAHDLKTPLTRLRQRAEAALGGDESERGEALETTIVEADRMIGTFEALLMISRVEAGAHQVLKGPADLSRIAADVVELYEPSAEDLGGFLKLEAPEHLPLMASRELLAQALANLVDNALKHGAGEGAGPEVTITLTEGVSDCRIVVADRGAGVPADKRERVLERFYRMDESRSRPGSGLGLSLVRAIARLHGGDVALEDGSPGLRVVLTIAKGEGNDGEVGG